VGEEEELVLADGPPTLTPELIHIGARLLRDVARRVVGVEKVVLRVEQRAVPNLVEVAVKLVGSDLVK
jgi:hypothetical protein